MILMTTSRCCDEPLLVACLAFPLQQRLDALKAAHADYAADDAQCGMLALVEPGDAINPLEHALGCPILASWFGERYGEADFAPACEWLEEHLLFFELGFITSDSGYVSLLIVPKLTGIDGKLLAMCREFATPAFDACTRRFQ